MTRFDQVELEAVPGVFAEGEDVAGGVPTVSQSCEASRWRRLGALLTDLSLFVALSLALLPLLPPQPSWLLQSALGGFVLVMSYYYFVGSWLLWGKTIGGTIFDVRVVPADGGAMSLHSASVRWSTLLLSLATCGIGFLLAALPSRRSLPDRLSGTRCVTA